MEGEEEFSAFVRSSSVELHRMALLLTGEWSAAQDLVQVSLIKTWQRWPSIGNREAPGPYVRRVMFTSFLGWRRRRWVGEVAVGWLPEEIDGVDVVGDLAQHDVVLVALRRLPERQRAVVVLRYFADLSEQDTAAVMGCSVGTVKSQAFRALSTLRANASLRAAIVEGSR